MATSSAEVIDRIDVKLSIYTVNRNDLFTGMEGVFLVTAYWLYRNILITNDFFQVIYIYILISEFTHWAGDAILGVTGKYWQYYFLFTKSTLANILYQHYLIFICHMYWVCTWSVRCWKEGQVMRDITVQRSPSAHVCCEVRQDLL